MWPVCEVTCKIQINSDNSLSSVTQRSSALPEKYELLSTWPENDISGLSGHLDICVLDTRANVTAPPSIAQGLMNRQIPGSSHFDDDDLIRFRGGLIMPRHWRYHCGHAGTMITMCFGSFLIVSLLARRKKRNASHGPDEKQQNTFRHRQLDEHMV